MARIRISSKLQLPLEVAGEAIAILAKRGAGKTNTATVLVEELFAAGVQTARSAPSACSSTRAPATSPRCRCSSWKA